MEASTIDHLLSTASQPVTVDTAALAADLADARSEDSSTTAKVLSGIGGFFASLLFVLFIFLADLFSSTEALLFFGIALVIATILLGRHPRQAFLATVIVCGYVLGVLLVIFGCLDGLSDGEITIPVIIIALLTILVTKNYYLVLLAVISLPASLLFLHLTEALGWFTQVAILLTTLGLLCVSLYEHRLLTDRRYPALRSGLVLGLAISLLWFRWGDYFGGPQNVHGSYWITGAGLYLLWLWAIFRVLGSHRTILLGIVLLPLVLLPPLLGSFLLLFISYRNQHFLGIGTGVAGLLYFTAQYYYDLRWSLLDKSLILMASGLFLLVGYYFFQRKFPRREAT